MVGGNTLTSNDYTLATGGCNEIVCGYTLMSNDCTLMIG
jgi:hypothetical protein